MGDMKRSARGVDDEDRGAEIDPFAELADIFDSELGQSAFRSTADRHFADSPPMDADFEADFADALEADMAPVRKSHAFVSMPVIAPVAVQSYQNWVAPRGARASIPVDPAARSASSGGQSYIETAFRELSAPANPRDMIVVEAQSFAPERMLDDGLREPAAPELDDFDELIASELAAMNVPRRAAPLAAANSLHDNRQHHGENSAYASAEDNDADEDEDYAGARGGVHRSFLARRMAVLGGSVITLALLGTVGFFAWNNAGDRNLAESGGPLLIKADAEPYKMVPKDPGGRSIPNQNKAVYERVASPGIEPTPTQSALLTDSEEPMDLPVEEEVAAYDDLPGVDLADNEGLGFKDEARIEEGALPFADSAPIPVLQPRKVRTMIVRSDGTIVQSEPAAAPPAMAAAAVATPIVMADAVPRPVAEPPVVNGAPALIEASSSVPRPQEVPFSSALVEELAPAQITAPEPTAGAVPGLPTQVADPVEVASIAPRPAEAPAPPAASAVAALVAGGYFVQISSQPSEALAQASLQTLGSRFASVIEGRSIGIQSADIPGKGTFYRVRVATASKDEAATLCNRLKSAGGNCFVAR